MRDVISFTASAADCQRLRDIELVPLGSQKHVWRARIVLVSSEGLGT
jgi:hypothetical protein